MSQSGIPLPSPSIETLSSLNSIVEGIVAFHRLLGDASKSIGCVINARFSRDYGTVLFGHGPSVELSISDAVQYLRLVVELGCLDDSETISVNIPVSSAVRIMSAEFLVDDCFHDMSDLRGIVKEACKKEIEKRYSSPKPPEVPASQPHDAAGSGDYQPPSISQIVSDFVDTAFRPHDTDQDGGRDIPPEKIPEKQPTDGP